MARREGQVRAVVVSIVSGKDGTQYAWCQAEGYESITFTIRKSVWKGRRKPAKGDSVWLSDLRVKDGKVRAMRATF